MGKQFVHLHTHTEFSLLDGATKIGALVKETVNRGWKAVAITDHGNMYGAMQIYAECLKSGIKAILGCEFYICHDRFNKQGKGDMAHIVLIAKNDKGYKNLLKLSGIAAKEGFYYKPRIDYAVLKEHAEGLICLSACLAGHIPQLILQNRYDDAKKMAIELSEMFEPGDFYLEIQNHGIPEQMDVIKGLDQISKETGIKLVATNDVHYLKKEDAEVQDILMCIQMQKTVDDPNRMKFDTDEFYYKTYEEMLEALPGYEDALDITNEIADKCDVTIRCKAHGDIPGIDKKYVLPANENFIPYYQAPNGMDNYEYLRKMTYEGLERKYGEITDAIRERAETELGIIHDQGFVEYFLVVWDYVNHARTHGISVGPGRGSGAGSIVAYAISITLVDPLKYDLLFERFIHKERVSMPDFDVDFDFDKRGDIIEYVKQKYSPANVAYIGTFGTMAAKNAIRDVARVLKIPYSTADKISKLIPAKLPDGIKKPPVLKYYFGTTGDPEKEKFIIPELREIYDGDPTLRKVIDIAIKMEGMPRNMSTHACGILIAPHAVEEYVPLSRNGDDISTQFSMTELESLGLLKMDFLGLRTLTDIDKALTYIREGRGVDIDFYSKDMNYNDPTVYKMLGEGKTDAVFQLESGGFKKFMKELKPDSLEDIIAGVSMYRPGPMAYIPKFTTNKHNPNLVEYAHPCLEPILNVTYGVIVYQEQVMKVFQAMGGYNMGQADNVRRIMGKKKVDKMAYEKEKFINGWEDPAGLKSIPGAIKLGVPEDVALDVFGQMEAFASYAFNKSHAAAYSFLTFQTAYLKCYYPVEFLTSVINNRITNADEVSTYLTFARSEGIDILPADVNESKTFFSVDGDKIRFGLSAIRGIGTEICDAIVKERQENGKFKDLGDFLVRTIDMKINKRVIEGMIYSGAFDSFGKTRSQLASVYEIAMNCAVKDRNSRLTGQFSMFGDLFSKEESIKIDYPNIQEYDHKFKLKKEKEALGIYMSGHPLEPYGKLLETFNFNASMIKELEQEEEGAEEEEEQLEVSHSEIQDGMQVNTGGVISEIKKMFTKVGNKPMAVLKIEDLYGSFEVMMFNKFYEQYKDSLIEDSVVTIGGRLSLRPGERPIIILDKIHFLYEDEVEEEEPQEKKKLVFNADVEKEVKKQNLYMKFNLDDENLKKQVYSILDSYPGEMETYVQHNKKLYMMGRKVDPTNMFMCEIKYLIGEDSVKIL